MGYAAEIKHIGIALRTEGYSFAEIASKIGISKSTASLWLRNVPLSLLAKNRLNKIRENARLKGNQTSRLQRQKLLNSIYEEVIINNQKAIFNSHSKKIMLALVYYCEGSKDPNGGVAFTNSDPFLLKYYVHAMRELFPIDEEKWSVHMHLHQYHNEKVQLNFWQNTLNISSKLFTKSFIKKESGITIRQNYQGCVRVRYKSSKFAKELLAIMKVHTQGL